MATDHPNCPCTRAGELEAEAVAWKLQEYADEFLDAHDRPGEVVAVVEQGALKILNDALLGEVEKDCERRLEEEYDEYADEFEFHLRELRATVARARYLSGIEFAARRRRPLPRNAPRFAATCWREVALIPRPSRPLQPKRASAAVRIGCCLVHS
jgi:hypothetical protein